MRCEALGRAFPNAMAIDQGNVGASTMRKPTPCDGKMNGGTPRLALLTSSPP